MRKYDNTLGSPREKAFTLVELLVVVAIIGVLVGIIVPSVSAMWNQRLESETEMLISGSLRSVQMQAKVKGERGLFFWVDPDDGVQRVAFIEAITDIYDKNDNLVPPQDSADLFRIVDGTVKRIPPPYRVAPLNILNKAADNTPFWAETEIGRHHSDLTSHVSGDFSRRHPNFLAILFDASGSLAANRSILIYDEPDPTAIPSGSTGSLTRLPVTHNVGMFSAWDSTNGWTTMQFPSSVEISGIIASQSGVAVNYGGGNSIRGLLMYDGAQCDELANQLVTGTTILYDYLAMNGIPFSINRVTGNLIRGLPGQSIQ